MPTGMTSAEFRVLMQQEYGTRITRTFRVLPILSWNTAISRIMQSTKTRGAAWQKGRGFKHIFEHGAKLVTLPEHKRKDLTDQSTDRVRKQRKRGEQWH